MNSKITSLNGHIKNLGLTYTILYLLQRLFYRREKLVKVKVPGLKKVIRLRNKTYDTHIFHQIFIREELNFDIGGTIFTIIDCGANIGLASLYLKRKFPHASIFAIEPESSNFNLLQLNTYGYSKIQCLNAAIWDADVDIRIFDNGGGNASFTVGVSQIDTSSTYLATIRGITIKSLLRDIRSDVDLIKIDIEGSEYELFNAQTIDWIHHVQNVAVEIHESMRPGATKLIHRAMGKKFSASMFGEYTIFKKVQL